MIAANENRTHIYRIRRKEDGLFLVSITYGQAHGNSVGTWNKNGSFWWQPDTIIRHINELCMFRVYVPEYEMKTEDLRKRRSRGVRQAARDAVNPFWTIFPFDVRLRTVRRVEEWAARYEVVATEINVLGEATIDAGKFMTIHSTKNKEKEIKNA